MDRFHIEATGGSLNQKQVIYSDYLAVDDHGKGLIIFRVKLDYDTVITLGVFT